MMKIFAGDHEYINHFSLFVEYLYFNLTFFLPTTRQTLFLVQGYIPPYFHD